MKKNNKKLITVLLAGALCATAAIGVAFSGDPVQASAAEPVTYSIGDVFSGNESGVIGAELQVATDTEETTAFTLKKNGYARIKRDLAFKWYEGKDDARYLTLKFALKDTNFKTLSFKVESESSIATDAGKATNVVKLTKGADGAISVSVISDGMDAEDATSHTTALAAGSEFTIALTEDGNEGYDEYSVTLDGTVIGKFTHLGSNFAEYVNETATKMYPLEISAEFEETDAPAEEGVETATPSTVVYLDEINNQKFNNIDKESATNAVKDTAPPVLVVNEDVNGFQLGTAFSLDYEKIDVLQTSSLSETRTYYQYNPTHTKPNYKNESGGDNTFTTSTYFLETVYQTEDGKYTSVYKENNGEEYISLKFTLGDNTFNDSLKDKEGDEKKTYELAWYAESGAWKALTQGEGESAVTTDFVVLHRKKEGAKYKYLLADAATKTNVVTDQAALDSQIEEFNKLLAEAASEVYAGSNSYINFPAFDWLIDDDNGYRNLRFSISYNTATASAQTSSNLTYSGLKLSASEQGIYEFRILAHDEGDNAMMYYNEDGELVEVTTGNIWDIEGIPTFTYEIKNQGLKVKDEDTLDADDRLDSEILDETYTFSGITIVGGDSQVRDYALYRINLSGAEGTLTQSDLTGVSYKDLRERIAERISEANNETFKGDYFKFYVDVYAQLIAERTGGEKDAIAACFEKITVYDEKIEKGDEGWDHNKFEWQKSTNASFKTAEEGLFVIVGDYWDSLLPTVSRTAAYKVIEVESEADVIKGETEWLKNNLASVILFSIAAVMLILIIILLLIKPSDETLEEVDEQADGKKAKSAKKDK